MAQSVDWVSTIPEEIGTFKGRAVVGGEEQGSPVWVIRATVYGDVVPGKIIVNTKEASVAWGGKKTDVYDIQVAMADPKTITWVPGTEGSVPSNAIVAGYVRTTGERLYVGRGRYLGDLIPGKIDPSQKSLHVTHAGGVAKLTNYDVLCYVPPK